MDVFEFAAICSWVNDYLYDNYTGDKIKIEPSAAYERHREIDSGLYSGDEAKGEAPLLAYTGAMIVDDQNGDSAAESYRPEYFQSLEDMSFGKALDFFIDMRLRDSHAKCEKRSYLPKGRYALLLHGEKPTKLEAMTLAFALELNLEEAELLLKTAGYEFKSDELPDMIAKALLDYYEHDVVVADDVFRKYGLKLLAKQPPIEY